MVQVRDKLGPLAIDELVEEGGTPLGYFCKHLFWGEKVTLLFDHYDPGKKGDVEYEMREALEREKPRSERRCAYVVHPLFK